MTALFSRAAEEAAVGSLLHDWEYCLTEGLEDVDPSWFYIRSNGQIVSTVQRLISRGQPAELPDVGEALHEHGMNAVDLMRLYDGVPSAASFPAHIQRVRDQYEKRQLVMSFYEAIQQSRDKTVGAEQLRELVDGALRKYDGTGCGEVVADMPALRERVLPQIVPARMRRPDQVVSTGVTEWDEILGGGFPKGSLNVLAGRPSMGKSALALKVASEVAKNMPVALFTLEMSADELFKNLLALHSGINSYHIRRGSYGDQGAYELVLEASKGIADLPLYVIETPLLGMGKLNALVRKMQYRHGVRLVIVDYLQLMEGSPDARTDNQRIAQLSRGIKLMANALALPVLLLSQLNRDVDSRQRTDHRPRLSDLRESGAIEQDADSVAFLYREAYYDRSLREREASDGVSKTELIVAKQRLGPTGTVLLRYRTRCGDFEEWVNGEEEESTDQADDFSFFC